MFRREFFKLAVRILVVTVIAGCMPNIPGNSGKNENLDNPTREPGLSSTQTFEPTVTPTEAPKEIPLPTEPDLDGASGSYTAEQIYLIQEDPLIKSQKEAIDRWVKWWGTAEKRPFEPSSTELHFKYLFDNSIDWTTPSAIPQGTDRALAGVLIEAGGEYKGRTFTIPMTSGGKYMEYPPNETAAQIPEDFEPLDLLGGDWQLAFRKGVFIRYDSGAKDGQKIKQWLKDSNHWQDFFQFQKDYSHVENFAQITLEDLLSDQHIEMELFAADPFPPEAFVPIFAEAKEDPGIKKWYVFTEKSDPRTNEYGTNPKTRAFKDSYFYLVKVPDYDKAEWLAVKGQLVLNSDRTSSILHYVSGKYSKGAENLWNAWYHPNILSLPLSYVYQEGFEIKKLPILLDEEGLWYYRKDGPIDKMIDDWILNGIVPHNLQKKILYPSSLVFGENYIVE